MNHASPSRQTDRWTGRQKERQAGRQAAHSVKQKHQELSGCHGYTPGVSLLLSVYVYCMHVYKHVLSFVLKALHLVPILEMMYLTFC